MQGGTLEVQTPTHLAIPHTHSQTQTHHRKAVTDIIFICISSRKMNKGRQTNTLTQHTCKLEIIFIIKKFNKIIIGFHRGWRIAQTGLYNDRPLVFLCLLRYTSMDLSSLNTHSWAYCMRNIFLKQISVSEKEIKDGPYLPVHENTQVVSIDTNSMADTEFQNNPYCSPSPILLH